MISILLSSSLLKDEILIYFNQLLSYFNNLISVNGLFEGNYIWGLSVLPEILFNSNDTLSTSLIYLSGLYIERDFDGIRQGLSIGLAYISILFYLDKKLNIKSILSLIILPVFTLTWFPISIQGILNKNDVEWSHTKHTRSMSIDELEKVN